MALRLRGPDDVVQARKEIKRFASALPFSAVDLDRIEVAAAELASNMVKHAGGGALEATRIASGGRRGLRLTARDSGPGIPDVPQALEPGFSTAGSLGVGLSTVREFMDTLSIASDPGQGTCVEATKWAR